VAIGLTGRAPCGRWGRIHSGDFPKGGVGCESGDRGPKKKGFVPRFWVGLDPGCRAGWRRGCHLGLSLTVAFASQRRARWWHRVCHVLRNSLPACHRGRSSEQTRLGRTNAIRSLIASKGTRRPSRSGQFLGHGSSNPTNHRRIASELGKGNRHVGGQCAFEAPYSTFHQRVRGCQG